MGLLSRALRMVSVDDLPMATRKDLAAWMGRAADREAFPVRRFRMSDVGEHWAEDAEAVAQYAAMPTDIPPILVRLGPDGRLRIVDGNHRFNAALSRGASEFDAIDYDELLRMMHA